jgi:hypothetical protein
VAGPKAKLSLNDLLPPAANFTLTKAKGARPNDEWGISGNLAKVHMYMHLYLPPYDTM